MHTQTILKKTGSDSDIQESMTILDGGMGRELERRGAPFRQPEWSALALSADPDSVRDVHLDYIKSGASVITTNSYAVTPFHLEERFFSEGAQLIRVAAQLAFEAVQASKSLDTLQLDPLQPVQIAGSLPPLFGSYRPDLFDPKRAPMIARPLLAEQIDYVDIWLVETQSSILEAITWQHLITDFTATQSKHSAKPIWVAFTLDDSALDMATDDNESDKHINTAKLRSGESVTQAVEAMLALSVDAILFNCSQPEVMNLALQTAKAALNKATVDTTITDKACNMQLGVYANAFASKQVHKQANAQLRQIRKDTTPENYLTWAKLWQASGATIIGGCCGIGTAHITQLAQHLAVK
ncbi:homocysteine S-methyltransferase family protein [Psychrobacter sp. DM8]|uniref:homocysteine S-methyltransferase family protein n=1 Tax=unclassified Psychrobacter TaxID=196806 RepID=UPI003F4F8622